MVRTALLSLAVAMVVVAVPRAGFALDTGAKVASVGYASHPASSLNRSLDYQNAGPGFPMTGVVGRGMAMVTTRIGTNRSTSNTYSAGDPAQQSVVGKGFGTIDSVQGRNDPPPSLSGTRARDYAGGLGM